MSPSAKEAFIPINVVLRFALLQETQRLGEMVIQDDSLMTELADQKILFLDLLFEWERSLELFLRCFEGGL